MGVQSPVAYLTLNANNFDNKLAFLLLLQNNPFSRLPSEIPDTNLNSFLQIPHNFKINGVGEDAMGLRVFSFTLSRRAKEWLWSHPLEPLKLEKVLSKHSYPNTFLPD